VTRLEPSQFAALSSHLGHAMIRAGLAETAPEQVVRHLFAAGDTARGRDLAEKAAAKSLASLAFDRAAEFLKSALNAGPRDAAHARALYLQLADALASAGRGAEAAESYLAAAAVPGTAESDRLDCRRHAADQLLVSGHVDRGLTEGSPVIGVVTSGGPGVYVGGAIGLAYVPIEKAAPGGTLTIDCRGKDVPATVVEGKFYKRPGK
jgi:hypothetical protein